MSCDHTAGCIERFSGGTFANVQENATKAAVLQVIRVAIMTQQKINHQKYRRIEWPKREQRRQQADVPREGVPQTGPTFKMQ